MDDEIYDWECDPRYTDCPTDQYPKFYDNGLELDNEVVNRRLASLDDIALLDDIDDPIGSIGSIDLIDPIAPIRRIPINYGNPLDLIDPNSLIDPIDPTGLIDPNYPRGFLNSLDKDQEEGNNLLTKESTLYFPEGEPVPMSYFLPETTIQNGTSFSMRYFTGLPGSGIVHNIFNIEPIMENAIDFPPSSKNDDDWSQDEDQREQRSNEEETDYEVDIENYQHNIGQLRDEVDDMESTLQYAKLVSKC